MKTKTTYLWILTTFTSYFGFAQVRVLHDPSNTTIYNRTWENDQLGLLWWNPDSMEVGQLFTTYKDFTGLAANDSMHLVREWTDSFVCFHHRYYQQYHNGIVLEGAEYRELFNDDYVILSNGWVAENMSLSADTIYSSAQALEVALAAVNAEQYPWDDTLPVFDDDSNEIVINTHPKGELLYTLMDDDTVAESKYKLAWKFIILSDIPFKTTYVYIDAQTGEVLKNQNAARQGDFTHIYYGIRTDLDTKYIGGLRDRHYLHANNGTRDIRTKDYHTKNNYSHWSYSSLPNDLDDHWDTDHWGATSAHYVVQVAWDMFLSLGKRNGMDGYGKGIRVYADLDDGTGQNASWIPEKSSNYEYISFSRGSRSNPMTWLPTTYDVAGHEFAHGVTHYESNLGGQQESGALDESFSDICGFMTERYAQPGSWDWTIGEDFVCPQIRDIQLPSSKTIPTGLGFAHPTYYPDWYQSSDWWTYPNNNDNGGVHINSSVQNRWFYLLSMGGIQISKQVMGIGVSKAALITYYSYLNLVGQTETYPQARAHAVAAARILFGKCSYEERQTCRAWAACNIGNYCECLDTTTEFFEGGCFSLSRSNMTQVDEIKFKAMSITMYPNPASNELFVNLGEFTFGDKQNLSLQMEIYDISAKKVKVFEPKSDQTIITVNINSLPPGLYSLRIIGNELNCVFRFIKQ